MWQFVCVCVYAYVCTWLIDKEWGNIIDSSSLTFLFTSVPNSWMVPSTFFTSTKVDSLLLSSSFNSLVSFGSSAAMRETGLKELASFWREMVKKWHGTYRKNTCTCVQCTCTCCIVHVYKPYRDKQRKSSKYYYELKLFWLEGLDTGTSLYLYRVLYTIKYLDGKRYLHCCHVVPSTWIRPDRTPAM